MNIKIPVPYFRPLFRYEHGKAKPVQAVTNLFKLLDRHPDLLEELKSA
ncbi:MAG: type II toxin-antitoxin system MqsA family antitoxin [Nitrospirae bacterium]|nr:type II toxin-antitoxin system MqsA family antitoxin [Nitrospirota bacterium]